VGRKQILFLLVMKIILLALTSCIGTNIPTPIFGLEVQEETPQPPEQYSELSNPLEGDRDAISAGEALFMANCSSCHGINGEGDGLAARNFEPPPGNLAVSQTSLGDAYLYWRISDGGLMEPFNSLMPAWRGLLDGEKIWQVISYIRTLRPQ
jgi:mono/diheme cytochrome c family protein